MAQVDWTELTGSAATSIIDRGVTSGIARPNGGGDFLYGFNSKLVEPGTAGLFANQTNFAPTPANKGGRVTGAIKRGVSGGNENFAPFLFIQLQGPAITDSGYVLGLSDGDPYHIVLAKKSLSTMLEDLAPDPDANGVLLRSTESFNIDTWHHLRMDAIVQGVGDVLLICYFNNLDANPVTAPVWNVIPGMEGDQHPTITGFVDDSLGVATGSPPFTNGRIGFGFRSEDVSRRSYLDHLTVSRQV